MKDRRPRKLKKIAKKRKAAADAFTIVKATMVSAQCAAQLVIVSATPTPHFIPTNVTAAEKALRITEIAINSASAIQRVLSDIKPWRAYA